MTRENIELSAGCQNDVLIPPLFAICLRSWTGKYFLNMKLGHSQVGSPEPFRNLIYSLNSKTTGVQLGQR